MSLIQSGHLRDCSEQKGDDEPVALELMRDARNVPVQTQRQLKQNES